MAGIGIETWDAWKFRPPGALTLDVKAKLIADVFVGCGIAVEALCVVFAIIWTRREKAKSDKEVAEANRLAREAGARAAEADLKRAELEAKLLPRMLTQEQWDFIQGLRGTFEEVSIAYETDAETRWFASQIRDAFNSAGIRVGTVARAPEVHTFGMMIYEPKGFDGARPRTVEPLVELFRKDDISTVGGIITEIPPDIVIGISAERSEVRPLLTVPMIIVGGRFVLPPPHIERAAKMAKAARAKQTGDTK